MSSVKRVSVLLLVAILCLDCCYAAAMPRNFDNRLTDDILVSPKKRPFCNAFTGCGRKRAPGNPGMPLQEFMKQRQFIDEDTSGSFVENDVLDNLSNKIILEAKLLEAMQEANAEIASRKHKEIYN